MFDLILHEKQEMMKDSAVHDNLLTKSSIGVIQRHIMPYHIDRDDFNIAATTNKINIRAMLCCPVVSKCQHTICSFK